MRTWRRLLAGAAILVLLGGLCGATVAGDPSPEVVEQTPQTGEQASEPSVLLPTELAGDHIGDDIVTLTGPELRDGMSHDGLVRMEAILVASGKSRADVVNVQYYGWPGDGGPALLGAVRIGGSDIVAVLDALEAGSRKASRTRVSRVPRSLARM